MASPLLLRQIIDVAIPAHSFHLLALLCAGMIITGTLGAAILMGINAITNWIGQRVVHSLRSDLYERVQRRDLGFFATQPTADIQARIASDIGGISDILTYTATSTLSAAVTFIAAGITMLILAWQLTVVCLVLGVLLGCVNRRFSARSRELATRRQEGMSQLLQLAGEDLTLSGTIFGRTFLQFGEQRSRFEAASLNVANLTYRQRLTGNMARGITGLTLSALPPLIYLAAGSSHGVSVGTAIVMVTLQLRLAGPIQQLLSLNGRTQSSAAMFNRVFEYLNADPESMLDPGILSSRPTKSGAAAALRIGHVSHTYPGVPSPALDVTDLEFPADSVSLVIGPTGSGKSTLALILAGLITPTTGAVERQYDGPGQGSQWRKTAAADLWRDVTLVAQETFLLNSSIRENLLFAQPRAVEREMLQALAAVRLSELIARLPDGLDSLVGERGHQLSGGERQRLALARALLVPSGVLIMDEATSALDNVTAAAVHESLRESGRWRTLIIIAHRIPRLTASDRVLLLDKGKVAHYGTHAVLAASCTEYRELITEQARCGVQSEINR